MTFRSFYNLNPYTTWTRSLDEWLFVVFDSFVDECGPFTSFPVSADARVDFDEDAAMQGTDAILCKFTKSRPISRFKIVLKMHK